MSPRRNGGTETNGPNAQARDVDRGCRHGPSARAAVGGRQPLVSSSIPWLGHHACARAHTPRMKVRGTRHGRTSSTYPLPATWNPWPTRDGGNQLSKRVSPVAPEARMENTTVVVRPTSNGLSTWPAARAETGGREGHHTSRWCFRERFVCAPLVRPCRRRRLSTTPPFVSVPPLLRG